MLTHIEAKVKAATSVGLVVGLVITLLNTLVGNSQLMAGLPGWLQSLLTLFGPPLAVFLAGWAAPHSPRVAPVPDPPASGGVNPAA